MSKESEKAFADEFLLVKATTGNICPLRNGDACQYSDCAWWIRRVEASSHAFVEGCAVGVIALMVGTT